MEGKLNFYLCTVSYSFVFEAVKTLRSAVITKTGLTHPLWCYRRSCSSRHRQWVRFPSAYRIGLAKRQPSEYPNPMRPIYEGIELREEACD